jgi:hypothetical protein
VTVARRVRRTVRVLLALGSAAGVTVALAQVPAQGAFTAVSGSTGNSVASAADFCTAPGPTTLYSVGDSWTDFSAQAATHGGDTFLKVSSSASTTARTWLRFGLTRPAGCFLTSAQLQVRARTPAAGRTIDVYRGDPLAPQWTSSTITWGNQPSGVGTAVGNGSLTSAGWQTWTVTDHVREQLRAGNNGFVLQDRNEGAGAVEQIYEDLQNATYPPTLVLVWE